MPFGPYVDFNDCVAQNQDKRSPGGFCNWLEDHILSAEPHLMTTSTDIVTRSVHNVPAFETGTWTDMNGTTVDFEDRDLLAMVESFNPDELSVPLKIGHTSPEFNAKIAAALGVPPEMVTGEGPEQLGQMRLGTVVELRVKGDQLFADFDDVPELIADLIESQGYVAVSSEMTGNLELHEWLVTAIALLGTQPPAVGSSTLDEANVFQAPRRDGQPALMFTMKPASTSDPDPTDAPTMLTRAGDLISRVARMFTQTAPATQPASIPHDVNWLMSVVEEFKSQNKALTLPLPFVRSICPECAIKMESLNITELKIQDLVIPETMKAALSQFESGSLFKSCMAMNLGDFDPGNREGFCAWLHNQVTGEWPTLDEPTATDGGNNVTTPTQTTVQNVLSPEDIERLPALYEALGLPPDAGLDDILAAIAAMKEGSEAMMSANQNGGGNTGAGGGAGDSNQTGVSSESFAALEARVATQDAYIASLEHKDLVATYSALANGWSASLGTPAQFGEELATLEETAGKPAVDGVVAAYQKANDSAQVSGMFTAQGSNRPTQNGDQNANRQPLDADIEKYMADNNATRPQALAYMARNRNAEFYAYQRAKRAG